MMEEVVTTGTIRRAKLQLKRHHQQTNTSASYILDAFSVAKLTVSEHWWEKYHIPRTDLLTPTSSGVS